MLTPTRPTHQTHSTHRTLQVPANAKHINLRWRLPNNGAFAAAAPQATDHLAEYLAAHASEATEAQEREQPQSTHGSHGAERELQGEGKERTRAHELERELERANARNQELQLRIDTLVRDVAQRESDASKRESFVAELEKTDLAEEHRTLHGHLAAVTAQLESVQANAATLHGRLVHKEAELLAAQAEAAAQRRRVAETEEVLRVSESGSSALEARGYEQYEQLTRAQSEAAEWECKSKRWSKERAGLQQKVDEASRQASRRRDELYFTRTNMLREQLKLRQELEGTLPPRTEGGARLGHTTAQPAVHRHTTTPPSHWTGLDGVARSPRSLDHVADFEAELLHEWRVAEVTVRVRVRVRVRARVPNPIPVPIPNFTSGA